MSKYLLIILALSAGTTIYAQQSYKAIISDTENELIPEGIAADSKTNTIYVSSINKHKIVAIDMNGKSRDFISSDQDGYMEGLGMTIDTKRNWLWALSVLKEDSLYHSKVHAFDLKTGRMMQQYELKDSSTHLLNDLTLMNDGNIYITDTYFGAIYKLDPRTKKLEQFVKSPLISYPNGIVGANNHLIFTTYTNGPVTLDLSDKSVSILPGIKDTLSSRGIDGLVLHDKTLFGVFNADEDNKKNRIVQFTLNEKADHVVAEKIFDRGNEYFEEPTTAAYLNNKLLVLSNSHIGTYFRNKTSTKGIEDKLKPVRIVVYDLP